MDLSRAEGVQVEATSLVDRGIAAVGQQGNVAVPTLSSPKKPWCRLACRIHCPGTEQMGKAIVAHSSCKGERVVASTALRSFRAQREFWEGPKGWIVSFASMCVTRSCAVVHKQHLEIRVL